MGISAELRITKVASPNQVAEELEPAVDNLVSHVALRMHRLVPKRSYRLDETIEQQPTTSAGGKVTGRVTFGGKSIRGKFVNYHLMVERGTSKMAAQPYARPALYQSRSADLKTKAAQR